MMYLANYLFRRETNKFIPVFEIIFATGLIFTVLTFVVGISVIFLAIKARKLHRLVRLRLMSSILVSLIHAISQVILIQQQYFQRVEFDETIPLIVASLAKQFFFGYITGLGFIVALDRWVATKAWQWYESGRSSTLLFYLLQEFVILSISLTIAFLYVYGHITAVGSYFCFTVQAVTASICIFLVFRRNLHEMQEIKQGAEINSYSVSKIFQIKENISVLQSYMRIARPLCALIIPPFSFITLHMLTPPDIGLDSLRVFAAALFELSLTIASLIVICLVPYYFPHLKQAVRREANNASSIAPIDANTNQAGAAYFEMLSKAWA